jgi:hypothetical protein
MPLRDFRGAALPGQSLVAYDSETLVDGTGAKPGAVRESWIADRNFSMRRILYGLHNRGCSFIVREHGRTSSPQALEEVRHRGRIKTGAVYVLKF